MEINDILGFGLDHGLDPLLLQLPWGLMHIVSSLWIWSPQSLPGQSLNFFLLPRPLSLAVQENYFEKIQEESIFLEYTNTQKYDKSRYMRSSEGLMILQLLHPWGSKSTKCPPFPPVEPKVSSRRLRKRTDGSPAYGNSREREGFGSLQSPRMFSTDRG